MNEFDISKKAKLRAMRLLERKDRTEKELCQKLLADYPEEIVREALEYVKSYGYVNDRRYAENFIRLRCRSKSRMQIFQELACRGIDRDLVQDAWEEVSSLESIDEKELIRSFVLKKFPSGSKLDVKQMRRLQGYLSRRGFSWETICSVLTEESIFLEGKT